jgi:hypothetical protein
LALELVALAVLFLLALVAIALAFIVINYTKQILVNTVLGLIALLVINYLAGLLSFNALKITINLFSIAITAVLGLAGVGLLIILNLLGIHV